MTSNQTFIQRDILIDGREFFNVQFIQCRIVFRGTGSVQFDNCVFTECEWVFDGPAENTLRFLAALATDLGEEARTMVMNMLNSIVNGQNDNVLRETRPPVAV